MKKFLFCLLLVSLVGFAMAQSNSQSPYLTKSYASADIRNVEVETSGGGIQVFGVAPSEARIEVYINSNNGEGTLSSDEIKDRLEKYYTVTISLEGGRLFAEAKAKSSLSGQWNNRHSLNISFHMFVPKSVSTHLNTSGGGISLTSLSNLQQWWT